MQNNTEDDLKDQQAAANTWQTLVEGGVTEETPLSFDFDFYARDKEAIQSLAAWLAEHDDCTLEIEAKGFWRKKWWLFGKTQPKTYSLETVLEWNAAMRELGRKYGCVFYGWGCLVDPEELRSNHGL